MYNSWHVPLRGLYTIKKTVKILMSKFWWEIWPCVECFDVQKNFDSKFWRIKTRLIFFDDSSNFWWVCGLLSKFWSNFSFICWWQKRKNYYMLAILSMFYILSFVSSVKLNRSHQNDLINMYHLKPNWVNKQKRVFIFEMYMYCRYVLKNYF